MFRTNFPATAETFFDRAAALERLDRLFARVRDGSPEWLALIGPRKVGKTSLLLECERRLADPRLTCVVVDVLEAAPLSSTWFRVYALRVVDRLLGPDAGADLTELAGRPAEYEAALQRSSRFIALTPQLRAQVLELPGRSLDQAGIVSCLELPERLSKELGARVVVAIDEFQELASLEGHSRLAPFKVMRSVWQRHRHVGYVISGSARTMLVELVTSERSPFFQHFAVLELEPFDDRDAISLLVDSAPPGRPITRDVARRAVEVIGGHPFYLQLLGETLTGLQPPLDELALKEALGQLLFTRTGRLSLYFENEYRRAVGRAASLAAVVTVLSAGSKRLSEVASAIGVANSAASSYLERLHDVVVRGEGDRWSLADPVFALWLRWRAPGGAAVPMSVIGDEAERTVSKTLAGLGFDLVYQSRASRGAFDLLATRGAHLLGIQVKRAPLPVRLRAVDWKRMEGEGKRLGWRWIVAVVTPEGTVHFLDPAKARAGKSGVTLSQTADIGNLLMWVDRPARVAQRRRK